MGECLLQLCRPASAALSAPLADVLHGITQKTFSVLTKVRLEFLVASSRRRRHHHKSPNILPSGCVPMSTAMTSSAESQTSVSTNSGSPKASR
jgi:hypothetical protein